MQNSEGV